MTNFRLHSIVPNPKGLIARTSGLLLSAVLMLSAGEAARAANLGPETSAAARIAAINTQDDRMQQVEAALDQRLEVLSNVICHEETSRFELDGGATRQTGTLDADVEVANGSEKYSGIHMNRKAFRDMQHVPGVWSVGEMATLIQITRDAIDNGNARLTTDDTAGSEHATVLTFAFPAYARRWYLKVKSELIWMPFEGRVWISPETGEILRVAWRANDLPGNSGVSEVLWTVNFNAVEISSRTLSLPTEASYQVTYRAGQNRIDRNVTHFSAYRRYGSDSAIHFDDLEGGE